MPTFNTSDLPAPAGSLTYPLHIYVDKASNRILSTYPVSYQIIEDVTNQRLLRYQTQHHLSLALPPIAKFAVQPSAIKIRFVWFEETHAYSQETQIPITPALREEAYTGLVNGKGIGNLWTAGDQIFTTRQMQIRLHEVSYIGEPYSDELVFILAEKASRAVPPDPEDPGPPPEPLVPEPPISLVPLRPLTQAKVNALTDEVINLFWEGTRTVEQVCAAALNTVIDDPSQGIQTGASLGTYVFTTVPPLQNWADGTNLFNTGVATIQANPRPHITDSTNYAAPV